jgi:hypothetical protein
MTGIAVLALQSPIFSFSGFSINAESDSKDTDDGPEAKSGLP